MNANVRDENFGRDLMLTGPCPSSISITFFVTFLGKIAQLAVKCTDESGALRCLKELGELGGS